MVRQKAQITIPASTSNLGASFDACGLALALYLKVNIEERASRFEIITTGEGAETVARDESNLIARVARFVADERKQTISGARLEVNSQIPLARGLGSSSAAIIAGISVYESLSGERLSEEEAFGYALRFEAHGDNLAPSLLGGLVVACIAERDGKRTLVTVKREWPDDVRIILAVPEFEMSTAEMRNALPDNVSMSDAVFSIQRASLLQAAITERRFDLISEALKDHLHQPHRAPRGPGLEDVLRMNEETHLYQGLLGVAMSGAGSTMMALATEGFDEIAQAMKERFDAVNVKSRTMQVEVDNRGRSIKYD